MRKAYTYTNNSHDSDRAIISSSSSDLYSRLSLDYALGIRYSFTPYWSMYLETSVGWSGLEWLDFSLPLVALGVNYTWGVSIVYCGCAMDEVQGQE